MFLIRICAGNALDGGNYIQKDYANEVASKLWDAGLFAEADVSSDTLKKKILNAEIARWNFILGESHRRAQRRAAVDGRSDC